MGGRIVVLHALLLCACENSAYLPLPCDPSDPRVRSVLYVVEPSPSASRDPSANRGVEIYAAAGCSGFTANLEVGSKITAIVSESSLTDLGLGPGPVRVENLGRRLPCSPWSTIALDGETWQLGEGVPEISEGVRLRNLDAEACLPANACGSRCFEDTACGRIELCSSVCLEDSVDAVCSRALAPPPILYFSSAPDVRTTSVTLTTNQTLYGRTVHLRTDNAQACFEVEGRPRNEPNGQGSCSKLQEWATMRPDPGRYSWYYENGAWLLEVRPVSTLFPPGTYHAYWRNIDTGASTRGSFTVIDP